MRSLLRKLFNDPIVIHCYYAFRYKDFVHLRGRVIQDRQIHYNAEDSWITSFIKMIKNLLTDEKKHFDLTIVCANEEYNIVTDYEGYFELRLQDASELSLTAYYDSSKSFVFNIEMINSPARFGVITDIDDTIMVTGVTTKFKWRVLLNTFFKNPWKRRSFEGFSVFLTDLSSKGSNPIFYISNSPWNMFYYLRSFIEHLKFPRGVLILRDISWSIFRRKKIEKKNKFKEIEKMMQVFDDLPFVLIGDSGEVDTDIYLSIARRYPERILSIYIRELPSAKRTDVINDLLDDVKDIPVLLFQNTAEVKAHALKHRLLTIID